MCLGHTHRPRPRSSKFRCQRLRNRSRGSLCDRSATPPCWSSTRSVTVPTDRAELGLGWHPRHHVQSGRRSPLLLASTKQQVSEGLMCTNVSLTTRLPSPPHLLRRTVETRPQALAPMGCGKPTTHRLHRIPGQQLPRPRPDPAFGASRSGRCRPNCSELGGGGGQGTQPRPSIRVRRRSRGRCGCRCWRQAKQGHAAGGSGGRLGGRWRGRVRGRHAVRLKSCSQVRQRRSRRCARRVVAAASPGRRGVLVAEVQAVSRCGGRHRAHAAPSTRARGRSRGSCGFAAAGTPSPSCTAPGRLAAGWAPAGRDGRRREALGALASRRRGDGWRCGQRSSRHGDGRSTIPHR